MRFLPVHQLSDLEGLIRYTGFLPLFRCSIPGFSVEENCASSVWFADGVEGPWDWRGQIARKNEILYGKFAENKAVFVHRDWFPVLCNYRRDGYDFDTLYELGMAGRRECAAMRALSGHASLLSGELSRAASFGKGGYKGFDAVMVHLQMQTYACIQGFEQKRNRQGQPYGFETTRYTTPERILGVEAIEAAYAEAPQESLRRMVTHLRGILPDVAAARIEAWLK